jgi:hypothetical protein
VTNRKRHNSSSAKQSISTEEGIKAAEEVMRLARNSKIDCALCGGLAMHIYGFTRATVDVDFVAARTLTLPRIKRLRMGGETYQLKVGSKKIDTAWIVRDDDKKEIYEVALSDAESTEDGIPIITREWMVILKYLAGRGRDQIDLSWLLREKGLVDRDLVKKHIRDFFGRFAYWPLADMDNLFLEADVMKARDEERE